MRILTTFFVCALLALASAAHAHSDAYFDSKPSPHGGQMRMAGPYHFELLVERGTLTVYVTDHAEAPIATEGATAVATIDAAGARTQIQLAPAGANLLKGAGDIALDDRGMRVSLTVTMRGAKAETARFKPLLRKPRPQ